MAGVTKWSFTRHLTKDYVHEMQASSCSWNEWSSQSKSNLSKLREAYDIVFRDFFDEISSKAKVVYEEVLPPPYPTSKRSRWKNKDPSYWTPECRENERLKCEARLAKIRKPEGY